MEADSITLIKLKYNTLSKNQKIIADYILNNKNKVILMPISTLSAECNSSEATVMRFLNKIGYTSYQVFRVEMAQAISSQTALDFYENIHFSNTDDRIGSGDSVDDVIQKVIMSTSNAINSLKSLINASDIEKFAGFLYNAQNIVLFGSGGSDLVAMDAFHKLLRLGLNVFHTSNQHFIYTRCNHLTEKDIVILISHSGESREVLDCARLARSCGAKVIAVTSYMKSSLTQIANLVLFSSVNETKYLTDAIISRLIQMVIMDMVYVALVLKLGDKAAKSINKSKKAVAFTKT